ncbi:MAG: ABC transporter permease [Clostridiales bacterium]|jgi:ABC-type Na+ efflux pump permease subunit|nr:ABC transporter permease [Clostridiales bacterium]
MKNNFRGWTAVFRFTFLQSTKKAFKIITTLIAVLIIGLIILLNIIAARPDKQEDHQGIGPETTMGISTINKVLIQDNSGLPATDYKALNPSLSEEYFNNIQFAIADISTREDLLEKASKDSDRTIAVLITSKDAAFEMEAIIPHNSIVARSDVDQLLAQMTSAFEGNKIMQANLSEEAVAAVFTPVITTYSEFGESGAAAAMVIKLVAPMVFSFMMYFMLLIYGQVVSKSVSTEKTSKLMETLLTSVHPYAMITGKVVAVTAIGLLQFIIWIVSGVVGLYGGNALAHKMYPGYESSVISIINFIKDNIGETGMTLPAVLLAILIFGIGFLFYCVLAALTGSMVSKPEDVASTQGLFQLPVIISWLLCYFAPLTGNYKLLSVARFIPFTAPFCVPSDLITGTIGLGEGLLSLLVLGVFSLIVIILSAKIYKGLVLYTGQKANIKMFVNILKS